MADDYGTDVSTFPVTDMTGRTIEGKRAVAECILRRYTTPNGSLRYDPDFGRDTREMLNEDLDEGDLATEAHALAREAEKDERVSRATVVLTLDAVASKLTVRVFGELLGGVAFDFVLGIDAVSAEILRVN